MLTDAAIRRAKPKDKPYKLSDAEGLYLLVQPNGTRLWRMKYRFGGKEKLLALGKYPAVSLAGARAAKDDAKEELRANRDPSLTKKKRKAEAACIKNHLQAVGEGWLEVNSSNWSAKHAEDVRSSLERFVWPKLGQIPVTDISPPMVLDVVEGIERDSAQETARRVRQRLSAIFTYGIARGLGQSDPAAVIKGALPPLKKGRQPAIINLDDLREMLRLAEATPAHPITLLAMRFLALTAVRPGEVRSMPWSEIEGDTWVIPAPRMKMRREHVVPLSRQALEVLDVARTLTGRGPLVFPNSRWAHRPMSENAIGYLLNRAGYAGRHVPHGFRASFSSIMNERCPDDRQIIDQMLAHVSKNQVEAAYNRAEYRDRKRQLAQDWADTLLDGFCCPADLLSHRRR
ncbi:integrase [Novacetimonas maltaceti]|uniref:Putative prophage CPS-53 integrase n=1 Tax=Novacetimonas maltaceti TaxID=1203393 RepID=A0A2S3W4R9_9PROT|nr:integrase arm-type DNA-binding domain-containing protein [Novacetimonas maltaceti]POF63874.1 putative prophage CPS-53 integrase [Novacetimonas maltaceti]PYD60284.1 integrase [Novacetimonas maltaceti]